MQLKTANELNMQAAIQQGLGTHYMLDERDNCGLCGEDLEGTVSEVQVASIINSTIETNTCTVYTDAEGAMRVANPDEFVRCFG